MTEPHPIPLRAPDDLHDWRVTAALTNAPSPTLASLRLLDADNPSAATEFMPPNHRVGVLLATGSAPAGSGSGHAPWRLVDRTPVSAAYEAEGTTPGMHQLRFELLPKGLRIETLLTPAHAERSGLVFAFPRSLLAADDRLCVHIGGLEPDLNSTGAHKPVPAEDAELVWQTSGRSLRLAAHKGSPGARWTLHRPAVPGQPGVAAAHIELWLRWAAPAQTNPDESPIAAGCTLFPRHGT